MDWKKTYYQVSHLLFFAKQRVFSVLSFLLPDNKIASRMRVVLLRLLGVKIGKNCIVRGGVQFQEGFSLTLGDNVFINTYALFDTAAPISIGRDVQIAYQVTFVTGGHEIGPHEGRAGAHKPEPIIVGDGAWIGARAVILPGVTIGAGAVVASGAVVTKDVLPDTLVAGVPARCLRSLS